MSAPVHPDPGRGKGNSSAISDASTSEKWGVVNWHSMPKNMDEVTLDWLHKVWSTDLESMEIEPLMAETRPGVMKTDGGGASGPTLGRLRLKWKPLANAKSCASDHPKHDKKNGKTRSLTIIRSALPETAVIKFTDNMAEPSQPIKVRALLSFSGIYMPELNSNEVTWYTNNCRNAVANDFNMPICYSAVCSSAKVRRPGFLGTILWDARVRYRTVLILEDTGVYKSPAQMSDLSHKRLGAVLNNQAKLHASYWGQYNRETNPNWLDMPGSKWAGECLWLSDIILGARVKGHILNKKMNMFPTGKLRRLVMKAWTKPLADKLFKEYANTDNPLTNPETVQAIIALEDVMKDTSIRKKVFDVLEPQTLLHGDGHCANYMFPDENSESTKHKVRPVFSIDFQMLGSGRASWDLVYFLFTSSSAEKSCFERDIKALEDYHCELVRVGKNNSKFDEAAFTIETLKKEYFRTAILCIAHMMLLMSDALSPRHLEWQATRKNDVEKKGETLTYSTVKLASKTFGKLLAYYQAGVFDRNYLS